jgi:biotin carboxyl carrier protein
MAMEIRWDDKIIEISEDASSNWEWTRKSEGVFQVRIDGKNYEVEAVEGPDASGNMIVRVEGVQREVQVLDERALLLDKMGKSTIGTEADLHLCAPMPGKVLSVLVEPGQSVKAGDSLLVLEAMKMENVIKAAFSATIEDVPAKSGMAVEKGELLVAFEA